MPQNGLLDRITEKNVPLRPIFFCGVFFEGLVSFHFARQTGGEEYRRKGEAALIFMRNWAKHSQWNFEDKYLILEAEKMYLSGCHDDASQLYKDAIRSAHDHKLIHEEAIASELAGDFFYERSCPQKSLALFKHSIKCYKEWGALAVARRVESSMHIRFGLNIAQLGSIDDSLAFIFASQQGSTKKRQEP